LGYAASKYSDRKKDKEHQSRERERRRMFTTLWYPAMEPC
jgi:hypothetical protein